MNDTVNPPAQYCLSGQSEVDFQPAAGSEARSAAPPLQNYVPNPSDPLKIVCVNIHIFQDQWGQGNFQPSEESRLRQIVDWINDRFVHPSIPSRMCKPKERLLADTRIRFRIHRIEYYQVPALHVLLIKKIPEKASAAEKAALASYNDAARESGRAARQAAAVARDPSLLKQLNIYVSIPDPAGSGGGYAIMPSTLMSIDSNVVYLNPYAPQTDPLGLQGDFALSIMLGHELGHCLGLAHTYEGGGASPIANPADPEFLRDVFGTNPNTCPHEGGWGADFKLWPPKRTNNLMGGTQDASWISRLQGATMQRALTERSVRKYLATGCHDCGSCVAFTVWGASHRSSGAPAKLSYEAVELNETWGWSGLDFVAPVAGVYHFDLNFRKEGAAEGAAVVIRKNGSGWIAQARPGQGKDFGLGNVSVNAKLKRGDSVSTMVEGGSGERAISDYRFSGHLVCGCP
ncbi:MAG: hypothetical protein QOJ94_320 [Sphingomonadales bacterium]|jgi:hypothetical protein|nr:hypothetical protein [Sphingomonadales bacterium]